MNNRKMQLDANNIASFNWIRSSVFHSWLTSAEGLFWICGKPASGKSTLMRFLASSEYLTQNLPPRKDSWLVLEFYFDFRAQDSIANTPKGMFRALMFQMVEKSSHIAEFIHRSHAYDHMNYWIDRETELLDVVCKSIAEADIPVCALIDGLDEYTGRASDLAKRLLDLQARTGMKMIIASRPELMLQRFFETVPTLKMQDHNKATIRDYMTNAMKVLRADESTSLSSLCKVIEHEAQGVILWARFATDEIVESKILGATTTELEQVLRTYPRELTDIYAYVLNNLSLRESIHATVALQLLRTTPGHFYSDDLFVRWSVIIEKIDPHMDFDQHFGTKQFICRLRALLGDLLVISTGPWGQLNLIHETLYSFLDRNEDFKRVLQQHITSDFGTDLTMRADMILVNEATSTLQIDIAKAISLCDGVQFFDAKDQVLEYLATLSMPPKWTHRLQHLVRMIGSIIFSFNDSDDSSQIQSTLSFFQQPLFRLHGPFATPNECECSCKDYMSDPQETWYLSYLMYHQLWSSAKAGLKQHRHLLSPKTRKRMIKRIPFTIYGDSREAGLPSEHDYQSKMRSIIKILREVD